VNEVTQDLLSAVDALTKPVTLVRWQDVGHDHEWVQVVRPTTPEERAESRKKNPNQNAPLTVPVPGLYACEWHSPVLTTTQPQHRLPEQAVRRRTEASLLDQLKDAVASDKGQGGGRKPGREQVPIDVAALALYEFIDGRVRAWLDELGARPGKDVTPAQALRSWYTLWTAGQHVDGLEVRYRTVIEGWKQQILDKLQPPKRIELMAPCPICGKEWMNIGLKLPDGSDDPNDIEQVRVLSAVERESIDDSYALCQACDTVWLGVGRMRQLRISIDDQAPLTTRILIPEVRS
jgi:hypothetical protein